MATTPTWLSGLQSSQQLTTDSVLNNYLSTIANNYLQPQQDASQTPGLTQQNTLSPIVPATPATPTIGNNINPVQNNNTYTPVSGSGLVNFNGQQYQIVQTENGIDLQPYTGGVINPVDFDSKEKASQFGYNEAANIYYNAPTLTQFDPVTNEAQNKIYDIAGGDNPYINTALAAASGMTHVENPFLQGYGDISPTSGDFFNGLSGFSNPYGSAIGNGYNGENQAATNINYNDSNPFLNGFANYGIAQNTAFNSVLNNALDTVSDRVNSQFGLSGRTGSGAHQKLLTEGLGNVANSMYSDNFNSNMDRYFNALNAGASTYAQDQGRNLQSINLGMNQFNTDRNSNLDYLTQAGAFANSDFGNNLSVANNQLNQFNTGFDNQLRLNSDQANLFNIDQSRIIDAASRLPELANSRYTDALMLKDLGQQRDIMTQQLAAQPWDNLSRYMSIVDAAYEQQALPSDRQPSTIDRLIGLAPLAGLLA